MGRKERKSGSEEEEGEGGWVEEGDDEEKKECLRSSGQLLVWLASGKESAAAMLAFSRVSDFKVTPRAVIGPRRVQGRAESACTATARWFCRRKNGRRSSK